MRPVFKVEHGLAHRIEALKAYIACGTPDHPHHSQLMICQSCGAVTEIDDQRVDQITAEWAKSAGFVVAHRSVELLGSCSRCREGAPE